MLASEILLKNANTHFVKEISPAQIPVKYKMVITYDGTNYGGWQLQPNAVSIQGLIEQFLSIILRKQTQIIGSGRTDAGVHAMGQTAHFTSEKPIDIKKTQASLNGLLPPDIRVLSLEETSEHFHARYSAISKTYHYRLHLDSTADPFKQRYAYHVPHAVDLHLLQEAATKFIGSHDFTSFANEPGRGSAAHDAVRTLFRLDLVKEEGGARLEFQGDGFLYKMVRNIVGTLLDVCAGKISKDHISAILAAKDRRVAGRAAPAHGLHLIEVHYNTKRDK
jgi:tRNA pseudouridine38-40 synthase